MKNNPHLLILSNPQTNVQTIVRELALDSVTVDERDLKPETNLAACLQEIDPDLILADCSPSSPIGISSLTAARTHQPDIPFLFLSPEVGPLPRMLNDADVEASRRWEHLRPLVQSILQTLEEKKRRAEAEEAGQKTLKVLGAIRAIHRLNATEDDAWRCIAQACEIIYRHLGYSVWVAILDPRKQAHTSHAGPCQDFAGFLSSREMASPIPGWPPSTVLATGRPWVSHYRRETPATEIGEQAAAAGFNSVAISPLNDVDSAFGVVAFCSERTDAFGPDEMVLLQPVTDDLALAFREKQSGADLKHRKDAEGQLRLLSKALESAANGIVITDRHGALMWVNPAFTRLSGYSVEEVLGKKTSILASGMHDKSFYKHLWETILGGRVWHAEMVNRRKDGTLYTEETTITPVLDPHGQITHFIAVKQDVSARKRAEEQIFSQAALLEAAHDAITVQDLEGRIRFWNNGASGLYNWTLEEALGKPAEVVMPTSGPPNLAEVRKLVLDHGEWTGELTQTTRNGRELTVLSRWSLVSDSHGSPRSILTVSTDVTEKKKLEVQLMRAQRLESIGRLSSGIAHDLNNVLTPIMVAVELLRTNTSDEFDRRMLQTLETSVQRGAGILKQVLMFARGTEGAKAPLQPEQLIQEMGQIVKELFPKSVRIKVNYGRNLSQFEGDRTQMHQVLMNLCVNARDAMPSGGALQLGADNVSVSEEEAKANPKAKPGSYVRLSVKDSGSGIPQGVLEKLFDPFFTTKPPGQGTGLGLPTALGIIERHGGFMQVDTKVGEGTTFSAYLPASDAPRANNPVEVQTASARGRGELVLVIDDEEAVRELIRGVLEMFGYKVLLASDSEEALRLMRQHKTAIRVAVTDLMMPGVSGRALVEQLVAAQPELSLVVVTGIASGMDSICSAYPEAKAVLAKPFSAQDLLAAVDKIVAPAS